jgi:pimeloyl-ACP methyl ester carboxylesterase
LPFYHAYTHYEKASLHYIRIGNGQKVVLAFHGFGQNKTHFQRLAEQLSSTHTVYVFDLFYHGHSVWHQKTQPLTKLFWQQLMHQFLQENGIEKFSLMGFSMGGKFALATLESYSERIHELVLIAPDGIKTNFWYSIATLPGWTEKLFRKMIVSPDYFKRMAHTLRSFRVVDKGIVRFAENQMDTRQKRIRVYYTWIVFRELRFNMTLIAKLINSHGIHTRLFIGRYDRIITQRNMQRLLKRLHHYQLVILESGHNQLIAHVANYYARNGAVPDVTVVEK